jgi:hypothetical protein
VCSEILFEERQVLSRTRFCTVTGVLPIKHSEMGAIIVIIGPSPQFRPYLGGCSIRLLSFRMNCD